MLISNKKKQWSAMKLLSVRLKIKLTNQERMKKPKVLLFIFH